MTDDDIRQLLREMADEPVPADSLRRVRLAVSARAQASNRRWWWGAAILAAAVCIVSVVLWRPESSAIPKPAPAQIGQAPLVLPPQRALSPVRPKSPAPLGAGVKRERRPGAGKPVAAADFVIRIETPDPDVVILLIGD